MSSSSLHSWLLALECGAALLSSDGRIVEVNPRWPFGSAGSFSDIVPDCGHEPLLALTSGEHERIAWEVDWGTIVGRMAADDLVLLQLDASHTTSQMQRIIAHLPRLRLKLWTADDLQSSAKVFTFGQNLWPEAPPEGEAAADTWLAHIHPDDREKLAALTRPSDSELQVVEYRVCSPGGTENWARTRVTQLLDHQGEVASLVGVSGDITTEMAAREDLANIRARLELVLEGSRDGFWDWDIESGEMFLSARTLELLGYHSAEVQSYIEWMFSSIHPEDVSGVQDQVVATLKGLSSFLRTEIRARTREGRWMWVAIRGKVVYRDDNGRALRFVGTVSDISERRQLEEQLFQSQKMDSIGRMAGGIAHDFNNLVTGVMGYAELLQMRLSGDPRAAYVGEIVRAAQRAGELTSKLLDFARKRVVEPRVLDVGEIISDLRPMLERLIGEDIELSTQLADDLHAVRVDPSQFEQILINLAVNARDAMPDGGQITISTGNVRLDREYVRSNPDATEGPHVVLVVTDNGCGMDEATKWRVFEPFFTTKTQGKGTGLGLSTCYGIVVQAGGHLRVFSEPGAGASFRLYFPAVETPAQAVREPSGPMPVVSGEGQLVLLVEDEEIVRNVLTETLSTHGYRVIAACDGVDALAHFDACEEPIDLVLTDLVMPRMNGRELADTIRQRDPDANLMFMSGYVEDVVTPDVDRVLSKPFSSIELLDRIAKMLR